MNILTRQPARLLLLLLLAFASCDEQKSPEVKLAQVESVATMDSGDGKRAEVATAAREYLARAFPDWKLNGVSTIHYSDNTYYVFGDVVRGDERRTAGVRVALFVEDGGRAYWKAEHSPEEGEQRMPGYVVRPYQQ